MSDHTFYLLRDIIYDQSGIYFSDNKKYLLENRLLRRVEEGGFDSFDRYIEFLKYGPGRERELSILFDIITTNETSFFRDINQLSVFSDAILPRVIKDLESKRIKRLKIWSAACSTGEEPYTLSMIILEKFPHLLKTGWDIEIYGSDISEGVLSSARRGEYTTYSVRNVPPPYLTKYFTKNSNGRYCVKPDVKSLIRFSKINLFDDIKIRMLSGMQIIFCRNVLIYFDERSKKRVISKLYDCLISGGYLFIGHAESLFNISRAFKFVSVNNVLIYQK